VHSVIIERRAWLSNAEVDRRSATLLRDDLARRGVEVMLGETVTQLRGERRAEGVELVGGRHLDADIVIVCTGIAPNVELARGAGLRLDGGIVIDDAMRTSDPDVLACGDVARHEGTLSGRWPAAVEQAGVAAVTALGGHRPYVPGLIPTRLKVSGVTLNVVGAKEAGPGQEEFVETDRGTAGYRKLIVEDGRLAGALVYGDATGWDDLVAAVREQREVGSILGRLRAGDWGGLADRSGQRAA
jgi:nitrite reductase (NADH) large subunit